MADRAAGDALTGRFVRRAVFDAERGRLLGFRDGGAINNEVWCRIQRDLDLDELLPHI
jgi:hypothetical protein